MSGLCIIIGCGRTGTHLLARTLRKCPEALVAIEKAPVFAWTKKLILHPDLWPRLLPKILQEYRSKMMGRQAIYVDKSHPLLFFVDKILQEIPEARFVAMRRQPLPVVSSMLIHGDTASWCKKAQSATRPNKFLGIDTLMPFNEYLKLALEEKCALRWCAHENEIDNLIGNASVRIVQFEDFINNHKSEISSLSDFLGIKIPENRHIKKEVLNKWRKNLSDKQREMINNIVLQYRARGNGLI